MGIINGSTEEQNIGCIACGLIYQVKVGSEQLCPRRYQGPHSEEWKRLVVAQLVKMNVLPHKKPTKQEHNQAIRLAEVTEEAKKLGLKLNHDSRST